MNKTILVLMLSLIGSVLLAQNPEGAKKLVDEGIAYHDKGDYQGAISKCNKALLLDKDNLLALAEKAFSLLTMEKYEESIIECQTAIEKHPSDENLKNIYVTYGNALDALKKTDKSIEVYDEGIKLFPNYYQLHFNKGISLASVKKYDEAILCFQKSLINNPKHASSHNAIARILNFKNKRIPSLMSYCRFLVIEPEGNRAKENLQGLQKIMQGNAEKTGKKSMTITITPDMLADTAEDGKPKENSFTSTDLILAITAGLDFDKKNKKKNDAEKFKAKFETVCWSLAETKKDNYGFYWDFYVPYFIDMKDKNFLETFAYLAFASSEDEDVAKWLKSHKSEVSEFYEWSKSFEWKTE